MKMGLVARNLRKNFGGSDIFRDLCFAVEPGERLVIAGPSGCGKTTLLRVLAGLELPEQGEIWLDGILATNSKGALAPHRRDMGFVFQNSALWPHMTVKENIAFGLNALTGQEREIRITALLEQAGLGEYGGRYPHQLSGGEARRVSLLRSLAPHPRYLLMDEPFTNLDRRLKTSLLEYVLESVAAIGAALVYVSHDEEEVRTVGGEVLLLTAEL